MQVMLNFKSRGNVTFTTKEIVSFDSFKLKKLYLVKGSFNFSYNYHLSFKMIMEKVLYIGR